MSDALLSRIESKDAVVGIVGLGYVGLPLALACTHSGYQTIGIDLDPVKVNGINDGISHVNDVDSAQLAPLVTNGRLRASTDYSILSECDVVLICVPTPLNKTKDPDLSIVVGALRSVARNVRTGQLIVLESTTYPGFTREVGLPMMEESGLVCGRDFYLAFSPERTDPGNKQYTVSNTTKILGACTSKCENTAKALYSNIIDDVHVVSSTDAAEMVKMLENTFRAVNIGLVNEVAIMCHHLGINVWEVIEAASTKPFGFMPFYPGPGLGGHCIPVDPLYLSWKLRTHNYTARFIGLAQTVNASMPQFVVGLVSDALNTHSKAIRGSRITLLGVSYKKDTADIRESPALEIMAILKRKGAEVSYCDPHVPQVSVDRSTLSHVDIDTALSTTDIVVITADHSCFDFKQIVEKAPIVVDTRNATQNLELSAEQRAKVVLL